MSRSACAGIGSLCLLLYVVGIAHGAPFDEKFIFSHGYTPAFANKANGPDMLAFTADDTTATLNCPGYLSVLTFDKDGEVVGNPATGDIDWSFHIRAANDDGFISFMTHSEFNLGVLAEGEFWNDQRIDSGNGQTGGSCPDPADGNWDFEDNDGPGWEGESNYFWYNNAMPNQRGLGGSKYYFEYKNPDSFPGVEIFDEPDGPAPSGGIHKGYRYAQRLRQTNIAPLTGRTNFAVNYDVEVRGLMIPVSEIHSLAHGSLHPLFGWQGVDMADWIRETIGPLLDSNGYPVAPFSVWEIDGWNPPPYKYVLIYQAWARVDQTDFGTNGAAAMAFYGLTDDVSTTRRAYVAFKGDVPDSNDPIDLTPPADGMVNSWGRDEMRRDSGTVSGTTWHQAYGNLRVGTTGGVNVGWTFETVDPVAPDLRSLFLPAGTPASEAWVKLPTMTLRANQFAPLKGEAILSLDAGLTTDIHLALVHGSSVTAFATFTQGGPATVGIGGSIAGGPVTGGTGTTGTTNVTLTTSYSNLQLRYDPTTGSVKLIVDDVEVASHDAGPQSGQSVDGLYLWTSSGDKLWVDLLAVQSGAFTCGSVRQDVDADGDVDLNDFASFQVCFSGASIPHATGTLPSCACFDEDGDFDVDVNDFAVFQVCFNGASRPPACL